MASTMALLEDKARRWWCPWSGGFSSNNLVHVVIWRTRR
jgi:hypothetical protein